MKRLFKITLAVALTLLLASSCSRKGVHMSKHRKSRKCNCPTFVWQANDQQADAYAYPGGEI